MLGALRRISAIAAMAPTYVQWAPSKRVEILRATCHHAKAKLGGWYDLYNFILSKYIYTAGWFNFT